MSTSATGGDEAAGERASTERPLAGRRVVVTRPAAQAGGLVDALRARGAEAVLRPAIEIRPLEDPAPLDAALARLRDYAWVVFTSANGVRATWARRGAIGGEALELLEDGEEGRRPGCPRVAAIGPGTAAALERRGVRPDFVPAEYVAEALAEGLPGVAGRAVLLLRADAARPALREILARRGARVDDVPAYRTLADPVAGEEGAPAAGDVAPVSPVPRVDAVTFTSPSTVRGYVTREGRPPPEVAVVCIGPITARAAEALGLRVDAVAERYTVPGLVDALVGQLAPSFQAASGRSLAAGAGPATVPEW